jgi:NTE family protein
MTSKASEPRRIFAVFEGGGAKGIFHIATLRALQDQESSGAIEVKGYAGTSAGAIVACLAACGHKADELVRIKKDGSSYRFVSDLFDRDISGGVSEEVGATISAGKIRRPTDLLKWRHWKIIELLRYLHRNGGTATVAFWLFSFALALPVVYLAVTAIRGILLAEAVGPTGSFHGASAILLAVVYSAAFALMGFGIFFLRKLQGIASLWRLERALDCFIRDKVGRALTDAGAPLDPTKAVTFGDLERLGINLSIIATNVSLGQLHVFSTGDGRSGRISVARAAIASAAVPVLFRPVRIGDHSYCDGGLVSNLPSWVFDRETVNDARAVVVASNLVGDTNRALSLAGAAYFLAVARSAVFGADYLSQRGLRGLFTIELPAPIGLLDFDFDRGGIELMLHFLHAQNQAGIQLNELLNDERRLRKILDKIRSDLRSVGGYDETQIATVRSALARYSGNGRGRHDVFHLWDCVDFEGYPDRFLSLCPSGSMVATATARDAFEYVDLTTDDGKREFLKIDRDKLIEDRTPKDRMWSMAVALPVRQSDSSSNRRPLSVALTLDGAFPLAETQRQDIVDLVRSSWNST